ncbi:hypothetical protein [Pseudonocardia xinjiangensis]|uniref:Uncharacterized protein n=1 Tax=Pseudonocardia xinjiangensis TaxID=75289 RepID=A0ABX1RGQ5_9PSEU|nr:hypothetical protein [Pseudonocardia xinjiangensis]NMH78996.1 hypothetical protein [Pseudonocardia xinjiangensis]
MQNLPVILSGWKLTLVDPPERKIREDERGNLVPVTDRDGTAQFVVSLFAKLAVGPGQRAPKGEEIKVTLTADPGEGFHEGQRVELIDPQVSPYQVENRGRVSSGLSFKAAGLKPADPAPMPAPMPREKSA